MKTKERGHIQDKLSSVSAQAGHLSGSKRAKVR